MKKLAQQARALDGLACYGQEGGEEAIFWVHGYTMSSKIWGDLWAELPGYTHYAVDLPGHGASRPMASNESLPQLARLLGDFCMEKGILNLAGISFGGMIALQIAIERPAHFKKLLLNSAPLGGSSQDVHAQARNLELQRLYQQRGPGPWLSELWMQAPPDIFTGTRARPALFERMRSIVADHPWRELGDRSMAAFLSHVQRPQDLRGIQADTLLVVGDEDMDSFKRSAELIRRSIPTARRTYFPGCGHLSFIEEGTAAALAIDHFLKGEPWAS